MTKQYNENDVQDFISGLKTIIRTNWPSQEEFAKGVTSKVNMSNILRKTGGTSYKMREALAARAGMTMDDIIAVGRAKTKPEEVTTELRSINIVDETKIVDGKTATEIMTTATELAAAFHACVAEYLKDTATILRNVTSERDKLLSLLAQEQSIMNVLTLVIKVVDRDKKVVYSNRTMMELFQVMPGDTCSTGCACGFCDQEELCCVNQVFSKGRSTQRIVKHTDGNWYAVSAYPFMDNSWIVSKVVIVVEVLNEWFETLQNMGWKPPTGL